MNTILDEYRKEQNLFSVLALRTPTLKGAGLNPAGGTNMHRDNHLSSASCFFQSEVMNYRESGQGGYRPVRGSLRWLYRGGVPARQDRCLGGPGHPEISCISAEESQMIFVVFVRAVDKAAE